MPFVDLLTSSGLGSLLGIRHALEPDHLAAVTTLVSRERSSIRAAMLGACWGLGHTLALVVVGALLIVLRMEMPPALTEVFELGVALMLIALGVRAVLQAVRQGPDGPERLHRHGRVVHSHAGVPSHLHVGNWTLTQAAADRRGARARRQRCAHARARHASHDGVATFLYGALRAGIDVRWLRSGLQAGRSRVSAPIISWPASSRSPLDARPCCLDLPGAMRLSVA